MEIAYVEESLEKVNGEEKKDITRGQCKGKECHFGMSFSWFHVNQVAGARGNACVCIPKGSWRIR